MQRSIRNHHHVGLERASIHGSAQPNQATRHPLPHQQRPHQISHPNAPSPAQPSHPPPPPPTTAVRTKGPTPARRPPEPRSLPSQPLQNRLLQLHLSEQPPQHDVLLLKPLQTLRVISLETTILIPPPDSTSAQTPQAHNTHPRQPRHQRTPSRPAQACERPAPGCTTSCYSS